MSDKFTVEIISPDQTILKQDTTEVIIPSYEGQMGILNNHIPLITFLRPGIITIKNLKMINTDQKDNMIKEAEKILSSNQISDKQKYILDYKIETLKEINQ